LNEETTNEDDVNKARERFEKLTKQSSARMNKIGN